MKTAEGFIEYSAPQIAGRDEPFRSAIREHLKGHTQALEDLAIEMLAQHQPAPVGDRRGSPRQSDQTTRGSLFCCFASFTARGEAGSCSTVARCAGRSRVTNTIWPLANSSAS